MNVTAATRRRLENEILLAYRTLRGAPSGNLSLSELGFSKIPSRWHFTFTTTEGTPYPGKGKKYGRTNLDIACRISPEWIDNPILFRTTRGIIAGIRPLDPPEHVDSLELHYAYAFQGHRLAFKFSPYLTFRTGTITYSQDISPKPSQLFREIRINHAVFRKIIAKQIALRFCKSAA